MWILLSVSGCLPWINLEMDEDGKALTFPSREEAEKYAQEVCAWEYKLVEW